MAWGTASQVKLALAASTAATCRLEIASVGIMDAPCSSACLGVGSLSHTRTVTPDGQFALSPS
ncbi:MAG: hypothetical protein TH68_10650 [Candidatus Synechococcus spongiarum 142]|uniref:Uncharacterized protein n=1 Tax=Candidatus Synechococcus spongiarum 142 TaxID=1608213 RepID=A0A6N3X3R5_9SYNE|nr:MAG: hypothetical protein TH68_10650 [Candidatus Synechococcus spongiarum 142]